MTMIAVGTGWLLAGRALRPLREITATARRVSGENLGERIALDGPADELKELADTFDGMLTRLDRAFGSQRHFVANASHELRTPLAIMRTEIDVALADGAATPAELRGMGEAVRETIDRCERLIESLLVLARSADGFGLGLSIVRSVSEAHGGRTEIAAPASGGLEVRITPPAAEGPAPSVNVVPRQTSAALTKS